MCQVYNPPLMLRARRLTGWTREIAHFRGRDSACAWQRASLRDAQLRFDYDEAIIYLKGLVQRQGRRSAGAAKARTGD
jgi:hypothetical protein